SGALSALARRQGATLFMTLLAAFKVLLGRWADEKDVMVGTPIAGRTHRQIEELIGFFVNTLVLRTDLSGGTSGDGPAFQELLARVRQVAPDAYAHQDLPFEQLVEEVEPERDLSSTPLFQVMFILQNAPQATATGADRAVSPLPIEGETTKFDLTLSLRESDLGVSGSLAYRTDLFDDTTIDRLLAHYQRLLAAAVADPEARVGQLPWWTPAERHQLVAEWNDTATADRSEQSFHELLAGWVERTPDAVAVVFEDRRLSYRELDREANQLAQHLAARGVGGPASRPEMLVGICVERSPEMVVGILAILKAGGAWLPLDPEYPRERLAFMMADAGLSLVLTQERFLEALPEHEAEVICLDCEPAAAAPTAKTAGRVAGTHAAYVIYTSGSTGRPKGVVLTRRGLANLAAAQIRRFELGPEDRILQFASLNFDASVWEITIALGAGAALHLAPPDRLLP
ncbi:MAG: AMP-binding protein, partial [bacterium]|nr:AMP-binding protein [bacterium]